MKEINLSISKASKILSISFITTFLRIILQAFIPSSNGLILPESGIVKAGLLPIAFTMYAFIGYTLLVLVFVLIQDYLIGTKIQKGFLFGVLFAGMWVVYLFEPTGIPSNASFVDLLYYPIADGIAIILLGLLSGYYLAFDSIKALNITLNTVQLYIIVIIPLIFALGRLFAYKIVNIQSDFYKSPYFTLLWSLTTGLWFAVMYIGLMENIEKNSPLIKALFFSFILIGIDLFIFNFFIPLVFDINLVDLIMRGALDIFSLFIGSLLYEFIRRNLEK